MVALVFANRFYSATAGSKVPVTADVSQPATDQQPVTEAESFVTSPTIDTNSEFFFGSGDGSSGYYAAELPETDDHGEIPYAMPASMFGVWISTASAILIGIPRWMNLQPTMQNLDQ
jgi:hypothetical protein